MNEKGYKAYEPGLICRGKQYTENADFEEQGGRICRAGMMHYCVNPFEVLNYYPLVRADGKFSDFTSVTAIEPPVTDDGKKFATKKIHVGAKLGLDGFVKACVDFSVDKTINEMPKSEDVDVKDAAKIGSSGDDAQITIENAHNVAACVGKRGRIKAPVGTWCTLAEYGDWNGEGYPCICVKSFQIDGETYKADTWYTLKGRNVIEVE